MPQFGPRRGKLPFRDPESVSGRTADPNAQCLNLGFTMLEAPRGLQTSGRRAALTSISSAIGRNEIPIYALFEMSRWDTICCAFRPHSLAISINCETCPADERVRIRVPTEQKM